MNKYKPTIGIVGWSQGEKAFGASKSYLHYFGTFGNVITLNPTADIYPFLDLVVLPGGADTFALNYRKVPSYFNSAPDQYKDFFALHNVPRYIKAGVPVWGTCLGFQQLLVHFGEQLVQNIWNHPTSSEMDPSELVHGLVFANNPRALEVKKRAYELADIDAKKKIKVCSRHHQGVHKKLLTDEVNPICYDDNTGNVYVEVFEHKVLPVAGCQSHSEDDWNPVAEILINDLLKRSPNYLKYAEQSGKLQEANIQIA